MIRDLLQSAVLLMAPTRKNLAGGTVYGASKRKETATLNGGITTTASGLGTLGAAWKCDGSTGYFSGSDASTVSALTIFACFVPQSLSGQQTVFGYFDGVSVGSCVTIETNGTNATTNSRLGGNAYSSNVAIAVGDLVTGALVIEVDGSLNRWRTPYINGVQTDARGYLGNGAMPSMPYFCGGRNYAWTSFTDSFSGNIVFAIKFNALLSAGQIQSLDSSILTGEPCPLLSPRRRRRLAGSAGGAVAAGAGGIVANSSLIASSLYSAIAGIVTGLNTIASSLQSAAGGIQAVTNQSVTNNPVSGSASVQSASLESVLMNLAAGAAAVDGASIEQVLTNLTSAASITSGSSSQRASSIISALGVLQALSSQSTALVANGVAHVVSTGDASVLSNLAQLQEMLTAVATFTSSSIYQASMSLSESAQAQVTLALLSVAEHIEAMSAELASSVELPQSSGGASATVIASNLFAASARMSSSVSVSIGGLTAGDVDAIYYLPQRLKTFYLPQRSHVYYLDSRDN